MDTATIYGEMISCLAHSIASNCEHQQQEIQIQELTSHGIAIVLELDRAKGRVTETIGGKLPIYYNCEPPSAML